MDIREKVRTFPNRPGIYKFYSKGNIVYIGKSKNLRSRVNTYFSGHDSREKIFVMMKSIDDIEIIECDTHLEAIVLEYRQIQEFKPLYNSQYISDRNPIYMRFTNSKKILELSNDGDFGPFLGHRQWLNFLVDLSRLYPIERKDETYNFKYNVLEYRMSENQIEETTKSLKSVFSTKKNIEKFINIFEIMMNEAASELKFERANYFKQMIRQFKAISINIFKKQDFLNNIYILKEDGFLFYIKFGEIILKSEDMEIEKFIETSKNIDENDLKKELFSQELKYIIYKEAYSSGVELYKLN